MSNLVHNEQLKLVAYAGSNVGTLFAAIGGFSFVLHGPLSWFDGACWMALWASCQWAAYLLLQGLRTDPV